jgi:hypothetical protein
VDVGRGQRYQAAQGGYGQATGAQLDTHAANEAAVCAVGHNLIGKVKRTSGYSGEIMYPIASTIYRVCERSKKDNAVTRVSCYKTFQQCPKDFAFVINEHNFPQQVTTQQQQTQEYVPQNSDNQLENTDLEQKGTWALTIF